MVEGRGTWSPCLYSMMTFFKLQLWKSLYYHVGNDLGLHLTGPVKIYHVKISSLYNQYLAWEPDESGGHGAKVENNTVHQIIPMI